MKKINKPILAFLLGVILMIIVTINLRDTVSIPLDKDIPISDSLDYSLFSPESDVFDSTSVIQNVDSLFMSNSGRKIEYIILHTTASKDGKPLTNEDLNRIWKQRGFGRPGYPIVVNPDGSTVFQRRFNDCIMSYEEMTWGAKGYNDKSIHIAWVGGYSGKDTRTQAQKNTLETLLIVLKMRCPDAKIIGHRDTGAKKSCPNFNVREEYTYIDTLIQKL